MSGQNKQMVSSRIRPQERQRQADLHQSQRAHTALRCANTQNACPDMMMILPLGGHVKPCTYQCLARLTNLPQSLTPDPPLPLRNASERGSAFDICGRTHGGTTKGWKDLIFTCFYIFRLLKLICLYCKFITCNCAGCATHTYMPALRQHCTPHLFLLHCYYSFMPL